MKIKPRDWVRWSDFITCAAVGYLLLSGTEDGALMAMVLFAAWVANVHYRGENS